MAAAALAVEHFNSRNASIIPQLANLTDCDVQLQIDGVYDTSSESHMASRSFLKELLRDNETDTELCALVGGHHDTPAQDLSLLAFALEVPMVVSRSWDVFIVSDPRTPLSTSVYPDTLGSAALVTSYLYSKGRTNYIAVLTQMSTPGLQRRSALAITFDFVGMKWMSSEFLAESDARSDSALGASQIGKRNIHVAVENIKKSGYRTIVLAADDPHDTFSSIADAVEALGMNNGDYFFVVFDVFDISILREASESNSNVTKLLNGAAYVVPQTRDFFLEEGVINDPFDPLRSNWIRKGQDFVDQVNALNLIADGEPGYIHAGPDFFQSVLPDYGAAFAYDAVMSVGGGACMAKKNEDGSIDGVEHHKGIRAFNFLGASGFVTFGRTAFERGGTRVAEKMVWASTNLLQTYPYYQTSEVIASTDGWITRLPYIYADGTNIPPDLRDEPNQNYLDPGIRAAGLSLMGVVIFLAIAISVWVMLYRKHQVLAASQPVFLLLICFGVVVQSSSVVTWAFDEQTGLDQDQLSSLCMAYPWMFCMGWIIVDAALFTKLWRVHKVLQFSRQKVRFAQVIWPMVLLCTAAFAILTLWNIIDPLVWNRKEIDASTGESIGMCDSSDNVTVFLVPLALVLLIPSCLMGLMAFRTKDVDEAFSESKWIFILILVQFEVVLVAAPVAIRLSNEEPNTRFLAFAGLTLSFPLTTLSFIFGPKILSFSRASRGHHSERPLRGERSKSVRVTGFAAGDTTLGPGAIHGSSMPELLSNAVSSLALLGISIKVIQ